MRGWIFILFLMACSLALPVQSASGQICHTEEALARQVLRCIQKGDSLGIRALVPTANDLLVAQDEERVPGAFRISSWEAEEIVHQIDSLAMTSFKQALKVSQLLPKRFLKAATIHKTEVPGDMPYSDIEVHIGKGSLSCTLLIPGAMGFSRTWTLSQEGFRFLCIQETESR